MTLAIRAIVTAISGAGTRFGSAVGGNVAILFAFASVAVAVGVGAGLDLSGAYAARQRLSQVATLTCQYSTRESVINTQSSIATATFATYVSAVNTFATNALVAQHLDPTKVTATDGSNGGSPSIVGYFTATAGASGPTGGVTDLTMTYPTAFLKIVNVSSVPLHARIGCQNATTATQPVTSSFVLQEGFETGCATYCYTLPNGQAGALTYPSSTFGSTPTYTGSGGFSFYVIGYCLEVDVVGIISSSVPEGTHSAELDCDNSSHSAGNSSISSRVFLSAGSYELRYNYRSRVDYPHYDPIYICGSTDADVSWANDTYTPTGPNLSSLRTNQINVYLDPTTATAYPPLHYTIYGLATEQLAGASGDEIDECVYSPTWVERSVKIQVSTAGYYWLSFAADGANDSYGGQLDNIRLCNGTCPGTPQDNFPSTAAQQLNFTTAVATMATWGWNSYVAGALGTFISPICSGTTFVTCSNPARSAGTSVLLDPGFYELSYQYLSLATYSGAPLVGCLQTPGASDISPFTSKSVTATNPKVLLGSTYVTKADVDMVGVYMSYPGQTLTPNIGGAVTLANPLIDACLYSTTTLTRAIGLQITKPGLYNLAYYAAGTSNTAYLGGAVGTLTSMQLKPLASPYTMSASSQCPAVPATSPIAGTALTPSGGGFTFTSSDPFLRGAASGGCVPN